MNFTVLMLMVASVVLFIMSGMEQIVWQKLFPDNQYASPKAVVMLSSGVVFFLLGLFIASFSI